MQYQNSTSAVPKKNDNIPSQSKKSIFQIYFFDSFLVWGMQLIISQGSFSVLREFLTLHAY